LPRILSTNRSSMWCGDLGFNRRANADKFAGLETITAATGSPILADSLAWIDCRVEARFDTGDRTIYLAEVIEAAILRDARPLNLQRLLKLAPPEKRELLRTQLAADASHDAVAIANWREAR
jgi:flavin reductase (DIM6/NTAB) family NADH-FMN oxidoreductase RutF